MTRSRLVLEFVLSIAFLVPLEGDVDLESVVSMEILTLLWCLITSIYAERPRRTSAHLHSMEILTLLWCLITSIYAERPRRTSAHLQLRELQRFRKSLEAARSNQIFPREKVVPG
jgi:hypothetical protein